MTPDQQFVLALVQSIIPALASLSAAFIAAYVAVRQNGLRKDMNGKMDQMVRLERTDAHRKGRDEAFQEVVDRDLATTYPYPTEKNEASTLPPLKPEREKERGPL